MPHDHDDHNDGVSRRHALECMIWAGTGVLWTVSGGVPKSLSLLDKAEAATAASSFTFLQISDSHVGFDKQPNPNALGTLQEAVDKIKALPNTPAFMLHTGDITHLAKPAQFDNASQVIGSAGLDVHYVPGEHDVLDDVAEVSAAGQGVGEAAGPSRGAVVLAEAGKHQRQALGETGELGGLPVGQLAEFEPRDADRRRREDVGAVDVTHVFQVHIRSF